MAAFASNRSDVFGERRGVFDVVVVGGGVDFGVVGAERGVKAEWGGSGLVIIFVFGETWDALLRLRFGFPHFV